MECSRFKYLPPFASLSNACADRSATSFLCPQLVVRLFVLYLALFSFVFCRLFSSPHLAHSHSLLFLFTPFHTISHMLSDLMRCTYPMCRSIGRSMPHMHAAQIASNPSKHGTYTSNYRTHLWFVATNGMKRRPTTVAKTNSGRHGARDRERGSESERERATERGLNHIDYVCFISIVGFARLISIAAIYTYTHMHIHTHAHTHAHIHRSTTYAGLLRMN